MPKFRKKPVVIEAIQYRIENKVEIQDFTKNKAFFPIDSDHEWVCKQCHAVASKHGNCETLEGVHIICPDDWIIKGVEGEFYPCKPNIFEKTYETV